MLLMKKKDERVGNHSQNPKNKSSSFSPPIRQTASIFKQSVTIIKSQESRVQLDNAHDVKEKPKQLFWEKRLQGLRACNENEEVIEYFELPKKIQAVGLKLGDETLLRSITTALHLKNHPVTGQNRPKSLLDKNPAAYVNPNQPLILGLHVTDEDIQLQEQKVAEAREKLKNALNRHHR